MRCIHLQNITLIQNHDFPNSTQWSVCHDGLKLACNKCHKLIQKGNFLRHMKIVHEGLRYNCNHCDKKYAEKAGLSQHIQSTHEGKMFTCKSQGCEKVFGLLCSMRSHLDKVHKS